MISARRLIVLLQIFLGGPTSAEGLSDMFAEGREAMRTALRELKDAGYVVSKKVRIQGQILTTTEISEDGLRFLEDRLLGNRRLENRRRISGLQG